MLGKLDDLNLGMGLNAVQDQVIGRKHAAFDGLGDAPSFLSKKNIAMIGALVALLIFLKSR